MSSNSLIPSPSGSIKPFLTSPEGRWTLVSVVAGGAIAIYVWGSVMLPWLLQAAVDTVRLGEELGIIAVMLYICLASKPRLAMRVMLQKFWSYFASVYPIQIIMDKIQQARKRMDAANTQIGKVKGSINEITRRMSKNDDERKQALEDAHYARGQLAKETNQIKVATYTSGVQLNSDIAQRRQESNARLQLILNRLNKLYEWLSHVAINSKYAIDTTTDQVNSTKTEFEVTNTAFGAASLAMKILKGDAGEEDLYNQAFAHIEQDISNKLGAMDDMQRVSADVMDGIDIRRGAISEKAMSAFDDYEKKLTLPGGNALGITAGAPTIPVAIQTDDKSFSYDGFLK